MSSSVSAMPYFCLDARISFAQFFYHTAVSFAHYTFEKQDQCLVKLIYDVEKISFSR